MAVTSRSVKCPECNVFTTDADYCMSCGELISHQKKVEIKEASIKEQLIQEEKWKLDHPNWVERMKKHSFMPYRLVGYLLYSVYFIVSAIGSVLAWSIAMVAAG